MKISDYIVERTAHKVELSILEQSGHETKWPDTAYSITARGLTNVTRPKIKINNVSFNHQRSVSVIPPVSGLAEYWFCFAFYEHKCILEYVGILFI